MIYRDKFLHSLSNHHLEKHGTSLEKISQEAGQIKSKRVKEEPWWLKYAFQDAREEKEWEEWAKAQVAKEYPGWDEIRLEKEFNFIHALTAPSSSYLFKTVPAGQLF